MYNINKAFTIEAGATNPSFPFPVALFMMGLMQRRGPRGFSFLGMRVAIARTILKRRESGDGQTDDEVFLFFLFAFDDQGFSR